MKLIFILPNKVYKERKKNTLQKESGVEALNISHKAYNIRLPQL